MVFWPRSGRFERQERTEIVNLKSLKIITMWLKEWWTLGCFNEWKYNEGRRDLKYTAKNFILALNGSRHFCRWNFVLWCECLLFAQLIATTFSCVFHTRFDIMFMMYHFSWNRFVSPLKCVAVSRFTSEIQTKCANISSAFGLTLAFDIRVAAKCITILNICGILSGCSFKLLRTQSHFHWLVGQQSEDAPKVVLLISHRHTSWPRKLLEKLLRFSCCVSDYRLTSDWLVAFRWLACEMACLPPNINSSHNFF